MSGGRGAWPAVLEPAWVGGWEGLGCLTAGPASAARHAWPRCTSVPWQPLRRPARPVLSPERAPAPSGTARLPCPALSAPLERGSGGREAAGRPAHSGPPSLPLTRPTPLWTRCIGRVASLARCPKSLTPRHLPVFLGGAEPRLPLGGRAGRGACKQAGVADAPPPSPSPPPPLPSPLPPVSRAAASPASSCCRHVGEGENGEGGGERGA